VRHSYRQPCALRSPAASQLGIHVKILSRRSDRPLHVWSNTVELRAGVGVMYMRTALMLSLGIYVIAASGPVITLMRRRNRLMISTR
jgi:hypothetical protein